MLFTQLPVLETKRLRLRMFTMDDAPALFRYASDPLVTQFITWETHTTLTDSQHFVRGVLDWYEDQEVAYWAIIHKEENRLIGSCGLFDWQIRPARAELAFAMSQPYWGKGYTSEAVRTLMKLGFEDMRLNRIEGKCVVQNTASSRVMEKTGMTYEGTLRQYIRLHGHYRDLKVFSILRKEWETIEKPDTN